MLALCLWRNFFAAKRWICDSRLTCCTFLFQITLHLDDICALYTIREKLGFGVVSIKGNTCSFRVHSFKVIVENLLPIFDKCSLLTHKQLNYIDWRKAIM